MPADRLFLVRHGETEGQSRIRLNGATDVPLSEHGRAQMRCVRDILTPVDVDRVISSPLSRSRESAEIVQGKRGLPIDVWDGFREIDFGEWETWTFEEVAELDPEGYATYRSATDDFQFPGGDSRKAFRARVATTALEAFGTAEGTVLAALHKGVIKVVTAAMLGASPDEYAHQPCHLGSITVMEHTDDGWALRTVNRVDHLGPFHLAD